MASLLSTNPYRSFTIDSGNELPEGRRNMWNTLHGHGAKPTGVGEHLSGPLSPIQTDLTEEKDKQVQTEIEKWAFEVHEVAHHEVTHKEGPLAIGSKEPLLKKVSEEVTQKAQEKLNKELAKRSSS